MPSILSGNAADVSSTHIQATVQHACRSLPPAWPLSSQVAVNPFLGQSAETLAQTGAGLSRLAGIPVTMPRAWYREKIDSGWMTQADIADAIESTIKTETSTGRSDLDIPAVMAELRHEAPRREMLPTIAALCVEITEIGGGTDWPALLAERIGHWASDYFDIGQALWPIRRGHGAWRCWRSVAIHDLTPEIHGLSGFADLAERSADDANHFITDAVYRLGVPVAAQVSYFRQLLLGLGGWGQYARYRQWTAERDGQSDDTVVDLLAIRLFWELALFERHGAALWKPWQQAMRAHAKPDGPDRDHHIDAILQQAAERAGQRRLAETLAAPQNADARDTASAANAGSSSRPILQMAFCIDVRSEVFRRALEACDSGIESFGFAGFFGLPTVHRRLASDIAEHRMPALLGSGPESCETGPADGSRDRKLRIAARALRAWGRFKLAAVSSFAFVESAAPLYAIKLIRDALGLATHGNGSKDQPRLATHATTPALTDQAEGILRAMSMTRDFARLVLLAGHGATTVNNPHAAALQCGACGGHAGDVNARLLASILNDSPVRRALAERGIAIPDDTLFLAALHDTTTDQVTIFDADHAIADHERDLSQARSWLSAAGAVARGERAGTLPGADGQGRDLIRRSRDWAQIRPEWGLAGCHTFIAAPHARTKGRCLEGKTFLHSYDWRRDDGFGILELIMTAPVVVASWINLQYYGSTVAPGAFGAGNKLIHNVVGGIGVLEGNDKTLRTGLPHQSVYDGRRPYHDPLRLTVCVEAPTRALTAILQRHPDLRALFDNGWLHLITMDDAGRLAWRYAGDLQWRPFTTEPATGWKIA